MTGLLTIIFIIVIHEFGHFIAGKLLHVPVYEFAVGMGPKIVSKKFKSETTYSLRAIPIGGFCSFDTGDITGIQDTALYKQPIWKRIVIYAAGAAMNILTAFIVAIIIVSAIGNQVGTNKIESIADERADSFFQPGDEIVSIGSINVSTYDEISNAVEMSIDDGKIQVSVMRNGEQVDGTVQLFEVNGEWKMGVGLLNGYQKSAHPIKDAANTCVAAGKSVFQALGGLLNGSIKTKDMSGIVGIATTINAGAKYGLMNVLYFFVLLSINIGIFNLLPLPVLDGSKILLSIYEAIFKKRVPEKIEENVTFFFAIAMIVFMVYITFNDVLKLL